MHAIQKTKFIIKRGDHFFPDKPIRKHIAKFYCIKFEGKVYEIRFFLTAYTEILKNPRKTPAGSTARGI